MNVKLSTGNINERYDIIDTIFAVDSHKQGLFTAADPNKAFDKVKEHLRNKCKSLGGDAVINCQFQYRVAVDSGLISSKQVMEIFAYGTAVKII